MHLLSRVERHLKHSGTPPTRFGRDCVHDPQFVFDLRRGREPGPEISARVAAYIERREALAETYPCRG
jgi:hypothetical protein